MLSNLNHEELKIILDRYYKKIRFWFLIALACLVVMALISEFVWDHWLIDTLAIAGFLYPGALSFYVMFKIEPIYEKIKPKHDFPLFQRDEAHYKKVMQFLKSVILITFIILIIFVIGKVFIRLEWIQSETPDGLDQAIIILLFIAGMASWTSSFIEIMRKQYVKYFASIDENKEKNHE